MNTSRQTLRDAACQADRADPERTGACRTLCMASGSPGDYNGALARTISKKEACAYDDN